MESPSNQAAERNSSEGERKIKVMVLGGAGDMGSRAVRELAKDPQVESLVIADYNYVKAMQLADSIRSPKIGVVKVDINDHAGLVRVMQNCDVVAGAAGPFYQYEVKCAQAAIEAGRHYISLCDDYDAAQAVMALDSSAKSKGVTVVTGLGWTPGISNILAKKGADQMDSVDEVNVAWGGSSSDSEGFAVVLHTIHIFTGKVPSFQNGQSVMVPAGSGKERVRFPMPVGEVNVFHLGHPEPVTLPKSINGVRTVTLKGGLSEDFLNNLCIGLNKLRLTDTADKRHRLGKIIKPLLPALGQIGKPENPCSAIRVDVKGWRDGKPVHLVYGAADHMMNLTGIPLAIGVVMLGTGQVSRPGVSGPESCIPAYQFIKELSRRGVTIYTGDDFSQSLT